MLKSSRPIYVFMNCSILVVIVSFTTSGFAQSPIGQAFFGGHVDYARINSLSPPPLSVPSGSGLVNIAERPLHIPLGTMRLWAPNMTWSEICPQRPLSDFSNCNWATFNGFITYLTKHPNIDAIYTFGNIPCWAGTCSPPTATCCATNITNISDWQNFVDQVVARANGKVKYFEVFNEPNLGWSGSISMLVQMAKTVWNAVKPNGTVLSPAPSSALSSLSGCATNWLSCYLSDGGVTYTDVIAFHGYVDNSSLTPAEDAASQIQGLQASVQNYGLPLWDTESNCGHFETNPPTPGILEPPDWHTSCMAQKYSLEAGLGIARMVWFTWAGQLGALHDPNHGPLDGTLYGGSLWNICYYDYNPCVDNKIDLGSIWEPGIAYINLSQWMTGASIEACVTVSTTIHTCNLTRSGYSGQIVWTTNLTQQTYNVPSGLTDYRDLIINFAQAIPSSGSIQISQRPTLVESSKVF